MKYWNAFFAILVVLIDQITKLIARNFLQPIREIKIFGPVYLTYAENTGAGFSIFTNQNTLLIYLMLIIVGLLIYYYDRFYIRERIYVCVIIGGAASNLIDRIVHGHVIDFMNLTIWPVFNIADIAITTGVAGLLYLSLKRV